MPKNSFIQKAIFPTAVTLVTLASFFVISATASDPLKKGGDTIQSTNISTAPLQPMTHQTQLKGYGEIEPAEVTQLSTQVSGVVVHWSDDFVRGGIIKKGEVLFTLEDSRYQAQYINAEAEILSAKADLERELGLAKVAKSELERINSKDKNSLFLREPQINSAYAAVKSAEAALVSAKIDLDSTVSKAPFDALVVERNIGLGQYVNLGNSIAVLYNIENAEIVVPIAKFDGQFLPANLQGHTAQIKVPTSDWSVTGQLSRQLGLTNNETRTNSLVVTINDLYQQKHGAVSLQFGDYVQVEFAGKALDNVYKVPENLVNSNQIWVVNPDNKLERRNVVVIRNENGFAIISDGIKRGDQLVTSVPEYPYQGMPVKVVANDSAQ